MTTFGGVYRAVLTTVLASGACKATIPQVFGDTEVPVEVYGATPAAGTKGFVSFVGGKAEYPVFTSAVASSTTTVIPAAPSYDLDGGDESD